MMIVCGLLVAGSSAWAEDAQDTKCTNRTLLGDYGFSIEGVILPGGIPLRGVAMSHFDGKGNYAQVDHVVAEPREAKPDEENSGVLLPAIFGETHRLASGQPYRIGSYWRW